MKIQTNEVKDFLSFWHQFLIDFWWRKKHNVAFGSSVHRSMNLIDMYIEYEEEMELNRINSEIEEQEDKDLNLIPKKDNVVKMSQSEIDDDFENLNLSDFDKQ